MSAWLIDTLLYTGLLIGLVLVLRRPVGRFFGPQLAYALWGLPFLRLLLPPIVLPASLAPEPVQAPAMAPAEWTPVAMDVPVETTVAAVPADALAPPAWEWADLIAPAASIWAGVALAFLVFRVVTYQRMRRELLEGARPVGEIGKVRLVETPALAAPVAFGVLDKVIALPPRFMAQPDIAARDLAIAHELAHHKGHDLLANFAAQALLALHWFNPLAWYGWRAMRRDQEAACDARVLAGRGREERIRYAALIAGFATGPRPILISGALAAPMACPVLGERSIVHRLRSLSMSETSRRRRLFGRGMIAAGALALPLTASISYAVAQESPAPAPPITSLDPDAPEASPAPDAPAAPEAEPHREVHTIIMRRGPDGEVRQFAMPHPGWQGAQNMPQPPQFHWRDGDWDSEEFRREMEQFQREMETFREQWSEKYGEQWEQWAENYAEHWEDWAEQHREQAERQRDRAEGRAERQAEAQQRRAQAQAQARAAVEVRRTQRWPQVAIAPEVVVHCDGAPATTGEDGRSRIVICNSQMRRFVFSDLRNARNSIANNREISEEVRNEILSDLDAEIERIERDTDD